MSLSQRLTDLRKENGISQMELAEELDISFQAVSRWETGESKPSTKNLMYLSKRYGVTVDYLLHGGELPPKQPEQNTAEVPAEPAKPKKRTWKVVVAVVAAVAALLLAAIIYMGMSDKEENTKVPYSGLKTDQVDSMTESEFQFNE